MSVPSTPPRPESSSSLELTSEELALLRASVAFHARCVSDPALRTLLENAAAKLSRLVPTPAPQAA